MMSIENSRDIDHIEADFLYDVTKTTVALFYLLQGMEIASHVYVSSPEEKSRPQLTVEGSTSDLPEDVPICFNNRTGHVGTEWRGCPISL